MCSMQLQALMHPRSTCCARNSAPPPCLPALLLPLPPALQPPPEKSVAGAIRTLQEVGALTAGEELTPLGAPRALCFLLFTV